MTIILKTNKVNLFVASFLFVFWYHSPNVLDTPRISGLAGLAVVHKRLLDGGWLCAAIFTPPVASEVINIDYY
jgi:hypothetical protein